MGISKNGIEGNKCLNTKQSGFDYLLKSYESNYFKTNFPNIGTAIVKYIEQNNESVLNHLLDLYIKDLVQKGVKEEIILLKVADFYNKGGKSDIFLNKLEELSGKAFYYRNYDFHDRVEKVLSYYGK